jgi:MFS transporter, DHA3 family, macrolide efflux protein
MAAPASGYRFRTFTIVWAGQFASMVGSNLTGFALGVYVYRLTGSAVTLGLVFTIALLPAILASPLTGPLVDRWGSRRSLLVSNTGAMAVTLALALLLWTGAFALWQVYVIVSALSVLGALEQPAFGSLAPRLVPKKQLDRANGMRMVAAASSEVLAPVTAGFLLLAIHIYGVILMDVVSFGLALATLLVVRIPHGEVAGQDEAGDEAAAAQDSAGGIGALLAEFREGWRYITQRRGLLALLLFLGAVNFSAGFIDLLLIPMVLSFGSSSALGTVLSIGGLGMISTGVAVSVWGGPRRRVRGILGFSLLLTVATVIGAARPNVAMVAIGAFVFMGSLGVIVSTNQSVWQTKVEPRMLGRAMAIVTMVASIPQLIAYALAGALADGVFEPLVGRDRVHSHALSLLIGDGPGRGIALLVMVMGLLIAVSVGVCAANPRLRRLEDELPDVPDVAQEDADGADGADEAVPEPAAARISTS